MLYLRSVIDVNVTAINEKGSVALHYVVKHPSSSAQLVVIQKLLSINPELHTIKNRNGETPLHAASLKANDKVCYYNQSSITSDVYLL